LFQRLPPLLVALTAFGLCSLVFLPVALIRDRGAPWPPIVRRPGRLGWINTTTARAWHDPSSSRARDHRAALVQILF
jgi:hypothetical protein